MKTPLRSPVATKIQDLPVEKRIELVKDLWDSIAADQDRVRLTAEQKAELDSRLDEFELDGDVGKSATDVLEQIRRSL